MYRKAILILTALAAVTALTAATASAQNFPKVREMRMDRAISPQGKACIECHKQRARASSRTGP